LRRIFLLLVIPLLSGCETLGYYAQAVSGHLDIMAAAKPVDAWLADPATPEALRERLATARRIRDFASQRLGLPDNKSYRSYAELGRPFAVWNVFAAAEFSVEAKQECFPVTGCVAYRGFFSEKDARRHADALRAKGYDVHVGGVPAYSTLGWFDDPLLSSFIRYPDPQLARLVFHELAHQLVYAPDDTTFNESFAVVVEEEGVRRWLESEGRQGELEGFHAAQQRRRVFAEKVKQARERLTAVYASGAPADEMRRRKAEEYEKLRAEYPNFVPAAPNNAFLVSIALYNELVPVLEDILREGGSLEAFYARAKELAKSGKLKRPKPPGPAASAQARPRS
jgi:predicted aminopeptidase